MQPANGKPTWHGSVKAAADAHILDTTDLDIDAAVCAAIAIVDNARR